MSEYRCPGCGQVVQTGHAQGCAAIQSVKPAAPPQATAAPGYIMEWTCRECGVLVQRDEAGVTTPVPVAALRAWLDQQIAKLTAQLTEFHPDNYHARGPFLFAREAFTAVRARLDAPEGQS